MKTLMTAIAAIAITSAVSAQNSCTVTTHCESKTYMTDISPVQSGNTIIIKDKNTGEVIDTLMCDKSGMRIKCSSAPIVPTTAPVTVPSTPNGPGTITINTSGDGVGTGTFTSSTTVGGVTTTQTQTQTSRANN